MIRIYVDFEMNIENIKNRKNIKNADLISIGAVKYNTKTGQVDKFKSLIKPITNLGIFPHIQELTNITQEDLDKAPLYESVIRQFKRWVGDFYELEGIYTFGTLDYTCLNITDKKSARKYNHPRYIHDLKHHFIDIKQKYVDEGINCINYLSLTNLLKFANIDFYGTAHDSLYDAYNLFLLAKIIEKNRDIKDILIIKDFVKSPFTDFNKELEECFEDFIDSVHNDDDYCNIYDICEEIVKSIIEYLNSLKSINLLEVGTIKEIKKNMEIIKRLSNLSSDYFYILKDLYLDVYELLEDVIYYDFSNEEYVEELVDIIEMFEEDLENEDIDVKYLKNSC